MKFDVIRCELFFFTNLLSFDIYFLQLNVWTYDKDRSSEVWHTGMGISGMLFVICDMVCFDSF